IIARWPKRNRRACLLRHPLPLGEDRGEGNHADAALTLALSQRERELLRGTRRTFTYEKGDGDWSSTILQRAAKLVAVLDAVKPPEVFWILFARFDFQIDKDRPVFLENFV